jgi:hypothetical protein
MWWVAIAIAGCPASDDAGSGGAGSEESAGTTASSRPCDSNAGEGACEAEGACVFLAAQEVSLADGECVWSDAELGWCLPAPTGVSTVPSWWHEVATGRVFAFANDPADPPPGWEYCTCDSPAAPACACASACEPPSDSSGASAE